MTRETKKEGRALHTATSFQPAISPTKPAKKANHKNLCRTERELKNI
jgi:hypothetical protein